MWKKKKISIVVIIALSIVAVLLLLFKGKNSTMDKYETSFAIDDTSTVSKVFIANKMGQSVKLVRQKEGTWQLNDKYEATIDNVRLLLATMKNIRVYSPIPKAAHNNIVKRMASASSKVEVFQNVYFIDFWGMKFFPYEKCTRTYYMGDPTMDNSGNFMMMEDAKRIYIVSLPGFRGFISPRYSFVESDWRDHTVFKAKLSQIKEVKYEFPNFENESFKVVALGNRRFDLIRLIDNQKVPQYDTTKLIDHLTLYRSLKYEAFVTDMEPVKKDSILRNNLFQITTLTENSGKVTKVKMYRVPELLIKDQSQMDIVEMDYSRDKFYIVMNDSKEMQIAQYFVFERLLQPLSYFLKR
jgi:hypothetical protein